MKQPKKTIDQKLAYLKKHHVFKRTDRPADSTIKRVYSKVMRDGLDVPLSEIYGMPKRLEKQIEQGRTLTTARGEITAKEYVRSIDKKTRTKIERDIVSTKAYRSMKFSHRYKSGKIDDSFRYHIHDGRGISVNALNVKGVLRELEAHIIPDLMEITHRIFKHRKIFYKDRLVGAVIMYQTKNMPDDPVPRGVSFVSIKEFPYYLHDMLYELLITDILRNYPEAIIHLHYFDIFIRTRETPTPVEQLL